MRGEKQFYIWARRIRAYISFVMLVVVALLQLPCGVDAAYCRYVHAICIVYVSAKAAAELS